MSTWPITVIRWSSASGRADDPKGERSQVDHARRPLPTIDGFTVEELIDTGGFSRVFRATQHGLDRPVAVKVLNSTLQDERQQRVFERECKVMGRLSNHPNIVTVYAPAFTDDMKPCIVMELYRGTFRNQGVLDVKQVVDVGAKLADALDAIHEEGIVHRDIKPHNVFVSDRGEPAIGDFGISSIDTERTVTGAAAFSVNYAPPEVFEEGGAEAPGDVYALGATLYQLATGEVPFPHTGSRERSAAGDGAQDHHRSPAVAACRRCARGPGSSAATLHGEASGGPARQCP